ncbi:MAG: 2-C-methyl-D-erythritol 4-phosphate cytidylyltransferase [Microscillaceae bacterium]|nr:2-C-methyl-D-erythritol 4-phosphate cytidylyltransferase [Microscillaceae bacterium]
MKKYSLIVAGGSGTRMNHSLPKQFIKIGNYPILMHTIFQFTRLNEPLEIILVLPENEIGTWNELVAAYNFKIQVQIVYGGNTRVESVKNGLAQIKEENSLVAIHDGVRPFIRPEIIQKSFDIAQEKGNAIVAVNPKDSIREIKGDRNVSRNRADYRLIQTPQTFKTPLIQEAYQQKNIELFTDDAGVAENNGLHIHLIEGDYRNIKITTPEDLLIAKAFLLQENM